MPQKSETSSASSDTDSSPEAPASQKEQPQESEPSKGAKKQKKQKKKKKKSRWKQMRSFLIKIGVTALLIFLALQFLVTVRIIHSNDMYPAVRDGQIILVSRLTEKLSESVVLYNAPDGTEHLGRILALPDSEVTILEDAGVQVNGNVIYQTVPYDTPLGKLSYPYQVKEGEYFILNDYREQENDSRIYGAIGEEDIIGVVVFALQYRGF